MMILVAMIIMMVIVDILFDDDGEKGPTNLGTGRQPPPPGLGQCLKVNILFLVPEHIYVIFLDTHSLDP